MHVIIDASVQNKNLSDAEGCERNVPGDYVSLGECACSHTRVQIGSCANASLNNSYTFWSYLAIHSCVAQASMSMS